MSDPITIFDFLKALTIKKFDYTKDERFEKYYNPFMINKFLSMHPATVLYAHYMNMYTLDKKSHFLFLFYALEKVNIFFKYQKKDKENLKHIKFIQDCYNISEEKAKDFAQILSKEQIKIIKNKYGGKGRQTS